MNRRTLLATLGVAPLVPRALRAQPLVAVRFAPIIVDDGTPSLYALASGLFRRAGLDVQSTPMTGGAAVAAAVLGGSIDIGISNMVSLTTAHEKSVPLTIASLGSAYNTKAPSVLMFVLRESPIAAMKDLNGKTIASTGFHDLNMTAALAWMEQQGGDPSTVRQVELPYPAQLPALENGRIDAAILLAPFSQQALANPKYRALAHPYDAVAPSFANGIYIASTSYVAANPDVVRRFARVIREASVYANAHHDQTAPILAAAANVDVEQIRRGTRATYFESLDFAKFQVLIDFLAKYKLLQRSFPAQEIVASPAVEAWR